MHTTHPQYPIRISQYSFLTQSLDKIHMGLSMSHRFLMFLLFVICLAIQETSRVEARPLPFHRQQSYSKTFATLGLLCKCCDGVSGDSGGEESCAASWDGSCSKLQCLPWKLQ